MQAERITSADQAIGVARELAGGFAVEAAERDRSRRLPHDELDRLSASGLLAVTVTMGAASALLSWRYRMPIISAWSTPGASASGRC